MEQGTHFGALDWGILIFYFVAMAAVGPIFARKNKSTEGFFLGNRSFPSWLLGVAMFATSISSITVVAYPADAFKTGYLRWIPALMLPVGILIASKISLPFFRRSRCISAYEYLQGRFGTGVRTYVSVIILCQQLMRIATILYLVSLVFLAITGYSQYFCIVLGGLVIGIYTTLGGFRAIVWTQFVQAFLLWFGAITCLVTVVLSIDGGISTIYSVAMENNKFMLGDPNPVTKELQMAPWIALREKAIIMMLLIGLGNWVFEYTANQNVIQKYVSAKNTKEAMRSAWICCFLSVPAWTFFMLLGTSLYVYFKQHPDQIVADIFAGKAKAEVILPHFCVTAIPSGVVGIVITGILAAAMSASAASIGSISAISITDIYKPFIAKGRDERHYVLAARVVSLASCLVMMGGAMLFIHWSNLTIQDLATKLTALLGGGILGLYLLGFLTKRGGARSVGVAIACTVLFSAYMTASDLKYITPDLYLSLGFSEGVAAVLAKPLDTYYVGVFGHLLLFVVAFLVSSLFDDAPKDLTNLTVWTTKPLPEEEEQAGA